MAGAHPPLSWVDGVPGVGPWEQRAAGPPPASPFPAVPCGAALGASVKQRISSCPECTAVLTRVGAACWSPPTGRLRGAEAGVSWAWGYAASSYTEPRLQDRGRGVPRHAGTCPSAPAVLAVGVMGPGSTPPRSTESWGGRSPRGSGWRGAWCRQGCWRWAAATAVSGAPACHPNNPAAMRSSPEELTA